MQTLQALAFLSVLRAPAPCCGRQVTHLELSGRWSAAQAAQALQLCMGGCLQLDAAMRASLRRPKPD